MWNYDKEKVELVKRYQVDITVTELYATGQFAAIGFSDQLRIMQIFLDDLNVCKCLYLFKVKVKIFVSKFRLLKRITFHDAQMLNTHILDI